MLDTEIVGAESKNECVVDEESEAAVLRDNETSSLADIEDVGDFELEGYGDKGTGRDKDILSELEEDTLILIE
ncbi:MAG: hypothetical protein NXI00_23185 [Cytophagales bacterium]|nr:hypothetical protein [Cytophagales bacterium]